MMSEGLGQCLSDNHLALYKTGEMWHQKHYNE